MHLPEYRNSICGLPSRLTGCIPSCECASKRGETEVTGSTVGLVPTNALVSGGGSLFTDWPETGLWEVCIVSSQPPKVRSAYEGLSRAIDQGAPVRFRSFSDFVLFETLACRCERIFPEIRSERRTYF